MFKLRQGNDESPKSLPLSGSQPTRIPQHKRECLTTEEAKVIYDCLRLDQTISSLHFNNDFPKLHVTREAAYMRLENILEEHGPLNPYEHMLLNPQHELPTKSPVLEDFYDMTGSGPRKPNTHHMEDWSILSTEIHYTHRRKQGTNNLLIMGGPQEALEKWANSSTAPTLQPVELPDTP